MFKRHGNPYDGTRLFLEDLSPSLNLKAYHEIHQLHMV